MPLPVSNSRIKLSQGQIFWREVGQGTALVFLHGSWSDGGEWLPVIECLSANYRCFAPDMLGAGESEMPPTRHYTVDLAVECLVEYLEALRLRRIYLVGHSLGAWVAASYALKYLDQVSGIVLLAPEGVQVQTLKGRWQGDRWLMTPLLGWLLRSLRPLSKLLQWRGIDRWLQVRRRLLQNPIACKLLFHRRWATIQAESLQDRLGWLKIPTLILYGQQASREVVALSQAYADLTPESHLQQIPQAGDDLLQTHPEAIAQQIRAFVKE